MGIRYRKEKQVIVLKLNDLVRKRIRQARKKAGLTLAELAEQMNLSGSVSVARYESGQRRISIDTLEEIARITGRQACWFVVGDASDCQEVQDICVNAEELRLLSDYRRLSPADQAQINNYTAYLVSRHIDTDAAGDKDARAAETHSDYK